MKGFASAMEYACKNSSSFSSEFIIEECKRLYSIEAFSKQLMREYQSILEKKV